MSQKWAGGSRRWRDHDSSTWWKGSSAACYGPSAQVSQVATFVKLRGSRGKMRLMERPCSGPDGGDWGRDAIESNAKRTPIVSRFRDRASARRIGQHAFTKCEDTNLGVAVAEPQKITFFLGAHVSWVVDRRFLTLRNESNALLTNFLASDSSISAVRTRTPTISLPNTFTSLTLPISRSLHLSHWRRRFATRHRPFHQVDELYIVAPDPT